MCYNMIRVCAHVNTKYKGTIINNHSQYNCLKRLKFNKKYGLTYTCVKTASVKKERFEHHILAPRRHMTPVIPAFL